MGNLGVVTITGNEWVNLNGATANHAGNETTITLKTDTPYTVELKQGSKIFLYIGQATDTPSNLEYFNLKLEEKTNFTLATGETLLVKQGIGTNASIINISE